MKMTRLLSRNTVLLYLYVSAISMLSIRALAQSETTAPPMPTLQMKASSYPMTPEEHAEAVGRSAVSASVAPRGFTPMVGGGGTPVDPEIVELARALKNDPGLIYQYVHDNIEFSPLWGELKGPTGTLLDGRGDAFDQAALMIALLTQASLTNTAITDPRFEFGTLHLTASQFQSWLGTDSQPQSICDVLGAGQIPAVSSSSCLSGTIPTIYHVWVEVTISGTPYYFDPSFKLHTWSTGILSSLGTAMGYSQATFLSDANVVNGTGVSPAPVTSVNRPQVRTDLQTYANTLASHIRGMPVGTGIQDVVGGSTILPASSLSGMNLSAMNGIGYSTPIDTWGATVPGACTSPSTSYHGSMSVTLPGGTAHCFNSDEVYGHTLTIIFDPSTYVPNLYEDGINLPSFTGTAQVHTTKVNVLLAASLPLTAMPTPNAQQIGVFSNTESAGYVVQNGWDQVGRGMIAKHRNLLNQLAASGASAISPMVLGETLAVTGYTWLAEVAAQQQLSDQLLGTRTDYFCGLGIVGESVGTSLTTVSTYVDLPINYVDGGTRQNGAFTGGVSVGTQNSLAALFDAAGTSSAFESAVLEQQEAPAGAPGVGFSAASTVKLLDMAVASGNTIYDINSANWSTIEPLLVAGSYTSSDLTKIGTWLSSGYRVIAPSNGQIAVGAWTGVGYKAIETIGSTIKYTEEISGSLAGGFLGMPVATGFGSGQISANAINQMAASYASAAAQYAFTQGPGPTNGGNGLPVFPGDPVDHVKGSYQYTHNDLTVGAKEFPYGLSFVRSYDSGAQTTPGPLGLGWNHNFNITATVNSDGFLGMGQGTALSAVSAIVALYISADLMNGIVLPAQPSLKNFVVETLVNRWFTDQLTQKVVNIATGWNTEQFTEMADGTYTPQMSSAATLDGSPGSFRYRSKTGDTLNFNNSSGQISSWSNAAGASVSFSYAGGDLSAVTNSATGRQLTFSYNVNHQISSVGDGTRTVTYGYTAYGTGSNSNLTSFTDAASEVTTFAYDTSGSQDTAGHLTKVFYPSNPTNPFLTNYYDSLGRVASQSDAIGNTSHMFFAGTRTEIDNPSSVRQVWTNDARGNVLSETQDYGGLNIQVMNSYDGQNNLKFTTYPQGNTVAYTYDGLFNPLMVTRTPNTMPVSSLAPQVQTLTYVTPISSFGNFEEVLTATDPKSKTTTFTYNSSTGSLIQINQPAVAKPGVGGTSAPVQVFSYTSIGLPYQVQDAEGRITQYVYDVTNADEVKTVTADYGHLNLITQYGYDAYGDVKSVLDANGNTTTSVFDFMRRSTEVDPPITGVQTLTTYFPDGQVQYVKRKTPAGTWETTQYAYTLSDKPSVVTDPLGNTTTMTYDIDDRTLTATTQVTATQTRQQTYSYDALSRPYQVNDTTGTPVLLETHTYTLDGLGASFTDANGNVMSYTYDGFDRLDHTTYPDSSTEAFVYDANSNVTQKTARNGQTISYSFDDINRMLTKTPFGEAVVTYGYDYSGRLLQASDTSLPNPYQIGYDTAGRANSYTDQQGRNTAVQYDGVGNRTRLQWPTGTSGGGGTYFVTYQFDAMNRMQEIDENGSLSTPLAKYQWDSLSRQTLITYGDATTDAYSAYDAGDNLQTLMQSFTGGSSVTFGYTWQKDHARASTSASNTAFQYIPTAGTISYATPNVNNGYTTSGPTTFSYDGNQNLNYDGFNTLTYDVENRLIQAVNITSGTSQYVYDPLGNRKQKTSGGFTTQFVLAGGDEIADYTGTGGGTASMLTVRGAGGLPVVAINLAVGGLHVYYHHDVLGSTVAVTQTGTSGAADVYTYGEFGAQGAGTWATYRYAGYRYDAETKLYYVRARCYNPMLGRFLQTDPIGLKGGNNLYAYVGNDPINLTDPTGLMVGEEMNSTSALLSLPALPSPNIVPMGLSFNTITGGPGSDTWVGQWQTSNPSPTGGYVVQRIDITSAAGAQMPPFWEAWPIPANSRYTSYYPDPADDTFLAPRGSVINASASFYWGLTLPSTFIPNNPATAAHILPSTTVDPQFSTTNATAPVNRTWTAP